MHKRRTHLRDQSIHPRKQASRRALIRQQRRKPLAVTLTLRGDAKQLFRDESLERRRNAEVSRTADAKQLVESVRHEDHFVPSHVVEEPIVVRSSGAITIPMNEKDFQGSKISKSLHIEDALQAFKPR